MAALEPTIEAERKSWRTSFERERGISWVAAELEAFESEAGLPMEALADGSVRVVRTPHGEPPAVAPVPDRDTHVLTLRTEAVDLRLLQLDLLADAAFPKGRVGLATNGNAVLTGVRVRAVSMADPEVATDVEIEHFWADHEQPNGDYDVDNLRGRGLGWALDGHQRRGDRTALLVAEAPFGFAGGTRVEVALEYRSRFPGHLAGRSRVRLGRGDFLPEDLPLRLGDWYAVAFGANRLPAAVRAKAVGVFEALYDHEFGPETSQQLDLTKTWGKSRLAHQPGYEDGKAHTLRGERKVTYLCRTVRLGARRTVRVSVGSDDGIRAYLNGSEVFGKKVLRGVKPAEDSFDLELPAGESVLVLKIVNSGGPGGFWFAVDTAADRVPSLQPVAYLGRSQPRADLERAFVAEWNVRGSPTYAKAEVERQAAIAARDELEKQTVPVLVMEEKPAPAETFVLRRGAYDAADKKRPVERRPPSFLGVPMPEGAPGDRLGFARWLTRVDHPLTARVHVNRLWQMFFGRGIVRSLENFGQQAPWPSHLQLLDWLATTFVESGWDQKALIRRLVTSATYRQSARRNEEAAAADPNNYLLAWFPRRRLAGELIRDLALHVSGALVDTVGGPSVRPYQPAGLWREVSIGGSSNTQVFRRDAGDALYRRSMYTFWKRTSPSPQMTTFDAPTREFCVVQRATTNTPLQMLVLWNDEQFLEAARGLAERTLRAAGTDRERLVSMFRRCTARRPNARELDALGRLLADYQRRYRGAPADAEALLEVGERPRDDTLPSSEVAAWAMIASTVLALDETLVVD